MSQTTTGHGRRPIRTPAAWQAADVLASSDWAVTLDDAEREEIRAAALAAGARGETALTLRRESFPLPIIETRVDEWSRQLDDGRGFLLLRRFPVDRLTEAETELAYVGLGLHLGTPVGQNKAGDVLTHIRD